MQISSSFLKLLAFPISQGLVKFMLVVFQKESDHIFCDFL